MLVRREAELCAKLKPGAVQAAANRAQRKIEERRDLLIITAFDLAEHQDRPVFGAEAVKCRLHLHGPLLAEDLRIRALGPWTMPLVVLHARVLRRGSHFSPPVFAHGDV